MFGLRATVVGYSWNDSRGKCARFIGVLLMYVVKHQAAALPLLAVGNGFEKLLALHVCNVSWVSRYPPDVLLLRLRSSVCYHPAILSLSFLLRWVTFAELTSTSWL